MVPRRHSTTHKEIVSVGFRPRLKPLAPTTRQWNTYDIEHTRIYPTYAWAEVKLTRDKGVKSQKNEKKRQLREQWRNKHMKASIYTLR